MVTDRLLLRPFQLKDAHEVQLLAGDRDIAATAWEIAHPYKDGLAEEWISTHKDKFERGEFVCFAIKHHENNHLIGSISLKISQHHNKAELGYWVGKPYWGNGYCTEAAIVILRYGFEQLGLNRIFALSMVGNDASGRVLEKVGMKYEGYIRQGILRWNVYKDINLYSILRNEY